LDSFSVALYQNFQFCGISARTIEFQLFFISFSAICSDAGPIDARWFAKGELLWKRLPTNSSYVPDGDRPVVVIIDDGALGDVCYAIHEDGYAPITLAPEPLNSSGLKLIVNDAHAGPRMVGGHIWASSEYYVLHLQFCDYPIVLGKELAGGLPADLPVLISRFFGFDADLLGIFLVGMQADATFLAETKIKNNSTLTDAIAAMNSVMQRNFLRWTRCASSGRSADLPPLVTGLIGI
jgi:hypothetical protein